MVNHNVIILKKIYAYIICSEFRSDKKKIKNFGYFSSLIIVIVEFVIYERGSSRGLMSYKFQVHTDILITL